MGSIIRYRLRQTPPQIRLIRVITDRVYEAPEESVPPKWDSRVFEYKGLRSPRCFMSTACRDTTSTGVLRPGSYEPVIKILPPGDYTFQVRAIDRDLNYSAMAQGSLW